MVRSVRAQLAAAQGDLDRGNLAAASGAMLALVGRLSEWQRLYDATAQFPSSGQRGTSDANLRAFARGDPVLF